MSEALRPRVKYVIGPDGSPLTIADLPPHDHEALGDPAQGGSRRGGARRICFPWKKRARAIR